MENLKIANSKSAHSRANLYEFYSKIEENLKIRFKNYKMQSLTGDDLLFWSEIVFAKLQSEGILAGHNSMNEEKLNIQDIYFLNSNGEIPELLSLFSQKGLKFLEKNQNEFYRLKEKPNEKFRRQELFEEFGSRDPKLIWLKIMSKSHCNAFIKLLRNKKNRRFF